MTVYWFAPKPSITQWVHNAKLTIILPYKLDTTNDLLTCLNNKRGLRPSTFIKTLILMQHEGRFHLDDIRHLEDDGSKALLQLALQRCKKVTLAIDATDDATEVVAHKTAAAWTVNKNQGCMPMLGHSAETGQIVAVDFRTGNVPPTGRTIRTGERFLVFD